MKNPNHRRKAAKAAIRPTEPTTFDLAAFLTSPGRGRSSAAYQRNDQIFKQGSSAAAVFCITKGNVVLTVLSEQGKEAVIARLGAGEFFGEACLAGQVRRMSSAEASTRSVIVRFTKKAMVGALEREPDFAELFTAYLLSRNVRIESDLVDQLFNSAERRLARLLLLLANFAKEGKMELVLPRVSRDVLAARVGTTRSKIDFFMEKFESLGFIELGVTEGNGNKDESLKVHTSLLNVVVHD